MIATKVKLFDDFEIPINCLKRLIHRDDSDKFFIIITSNNQEISRIETTKNKARVISSKIDQLYQIDPTVDKYELEFYPETKMNGNESQLYETIVRKLLKSITNEISFSFEEKIQLKKLEEYFGCPNYGIDINESEFKSINESISYLSTSLHEYSIKYLSSHMKEIIKGGEFFNFDEKICIEIIDKYFFDEEQSTTEIFSEIKKKEIDFIFNEIQGKMDDVVVMHFLFQMENDDYNEEMRKYISSHLSDEIVMNELGQIIRQYLKQLIKNCDDKKKQTKSSKIPAKKLDFENNGIISFLKITCGPDILTNGTLRINGGGVQNPSHPVSHVINYKETFHNYYSNHYGSLPNEKDGFIEFDFNERKVKVESYSMKKRLDELLEDVFCPRTWRICGSNDGRNWEIIDYRTNDKSLSENINEVRFECNANNDNYYRYIRYVLEKTWFPGFDFCIDISYIKLFGRVKI